MVHQLNNNFDLDALSSRFLIIHIQIYSRIYGEFRNNAVKLEIFVVDLKDWS